MTRKTWNNCCSLDYDLESDQGTLRKDLQSWQLRDFYDIKLKLNYYLSCALISSKRL